MARCVLLFTYQERILDNIGRNMLFYYRYLVVKVLAQQIIILLLGDGTTSFICGVTDNHCLAGIHRNGSLVLIVDRSPMYDLVRYILILFSGEQ